MDMTRLVFEYLQELAKNTERWRRQRDIWIAIDRAHRHPSASHHIRTHARTRIQTLSEYITEAQRDIEVLTVACDALSPHKTA